MGIVHAILKSSSGCGIFRAIWKAFSNCNIFRQQSHRSPATPPGRSDQKSAPSATQPDLETGLCSAFASLSPQVLHAVSASGSSLTPQPTMQSSAAQEQQQLNSGGASGSQHISPSKIKTQAVLQEEPQPASPLIPVFHRGNSLPDQAPHPSNLAREPQPNAEHLPEARESFQQPPSDAELPETTEVLPLHPTSETESIKITSSLENTFLVDIDGNLGSPQSSSSVSEASPNHKERQNYLRKQLEKAFLTRSDIQTKYLKGQVRLLKKYATLPAVDSSPAPAGGAGSSVDAGHVPMSHHPPVSSLVDKVVRYCVNADKNIYFLRLITAVELRNDDLFLHLEGLLKEDAVDATSEKLLSDENPFSPEAEVEEKLQNEVLDFISTHPALADRWSKEFESSLPCLSTEMTEIESPPPALPAVKAVEKVAAVETAEAQQEYDARHARTRLVPCAPLNPTAMFQYESLLKASTAFNAGLPAYPSFPSLEQPEQQPEPQSEHERKEGDDISEVFEYEYVQFVPRRRPLGPPPEMRGASEQNAYAGDSEVDSSPYPGPSFEAAACGKKKTRRGRRTRGRKSNSRPQAQIQQEIKEQSEMYYNAEEEEDEEENLYQGEEEEKVADQPSFPQELQPIGEAPVCAQQQQVQQDLSWVNASEVAALDEKNLRSIFITRSRMKENFIRAEILLLKAVAQDVKFASPGILVRNVLPSTTLDMLRDVFTSYGEIADICFPSDEGGVFENTLSARIFFREIKAAKRAIETLHNVTVKALSTKSPCPDRHIPLHVYYITPNNSVWVGNLLHTVTEEALLESFSPFGKIISVSIFHSGKPPYTHFAFVHYKSIVCSIKALRTLHNTKVPALCGKVKNLLVNFRKSNKANMPSQVSSSPSYPLPYIIDDKGRARELESCLKHSLVRILYNKKHSLHFVTGTSLSEVWGPDGKEQLLLHLEGIPELVLATSISNGDPYRLAHSEKTVAGIPGEVLELQVRLEKNPEQMLTVDEMATAHRNANMVSYWSVCAQQWEHHVQYNQQQQLQQQEESNGAGSSSNVPPVMTPQQFEVAITQDLLNMLHTSRSKYFNPGTRANGTGKYIKRNGPPFTAAADADLLAAAPEGVAAPSPMATPPHLKTYSGSPVVTSGGSGGKFSQRFATRNGGGGGDASRGGPVFSPSVFPALPGSSGLLRKSESPATGSPVKDYKEISVTLTETERNELGFVEDVKNY